MATTDKPAAASAASRQSATTRSAGRKTTTKKTAAKKTATSRTATAAKKPAAKKTARKKAAAKTTTPRRTATPLLEREPRELLEHAGYALAGLTADAVEFARHLPERLESVRTDVQKAAEDAPEHAKDLRGEAPHRMRTTVEELRTRVLEDLAGRRAGFERALDAKAEEGRKVAATVREDERVKRLLDQTTATRSQLKAAVTSLRRTADVAVETTKDLTREPEEPATEK